jgi:hypothetical protein
MQTGRAASPARIYALIAAGARKAVVFRRGPSKCVLVLSWDLKTDTLHSGQWFKGRIYERRCDLSLDGELLAYFAARHHGPLGTWTAVSRPPFLTALALWPKGDAYGGGGLFQDSRELHLNHRPGDEFALADGFALPRGFRVRPFGERPGWGEDAPIHTTRLAREGWRTVVSGEASPFSTKGLFHWTIDPPMVMEKPIGHGGKARLRVGLHGIGKRDGAWYAQTAQVVVSATGKVLDLGEIDWADTDHNGDVLFARDGCLYRLAQPLVSGAAPKLVADLNVLSFETRAAPGFARGWPKSARAGGVRRSVGHCR